MQMSKLIRSKIPYMGRDAHDIIDGPSCTSFRYLIKFKYVIGTIFSGYFMFRYFVLHSPLNAFQTLDLFVGGTPSCC